MGIVGRVDDAGETSLAAATAAIITARWSASGGTGHVPAPRGGAHGNHAGDYGNGDGGLGHAGSNGNGSRR